MKKIIYFIIFCFSLSVESFSAENGEPAWDLDNRCLYHTSTIPDQKLSYRELLERAKGFADSEDSWRIVEKTMALFSKPNGNFFPEGYAAKLPYEQWLDFSDSDFIAFRKARGQLKGIFSRELSSRLLNLKETEHALRDKNQYLNFNPLVYELDYALNILKVNSHEYIGSLT